VATKDAEVAFLNNISVATGLNNTAVEVLGFSFTLALGTNTIPGSNIEYTYNNADGWITIEGVNDPAVGILEEEGEDLTGTDVQNIVVVEAETDSDGIELEDTPTFSDDVNSGWLDIEDTDYEVAADRYGTYVKVDTDDDGSIEVSYPDTQVLMAVGIGSDPRFTVSGEGGTVDAASPITSPVAKLANEVNTATLDRDVIIFGGPCANELTATLMDVSMSWPDCFADFENLNQGIIRNFANAFGSGQKALVIAGKTGSDTRALAARALSGTADYSN
jgi:hypothetical protein